MESTIISRNRLVSDVARNLSKPLLALVSCNGVVCRFIICPIKNKC